MCGADTYSDLGSVGLLERGGWEVPISLCAALSSYQLLIDSVKSDTGVSVATTSTHLFSCSCTLGIIAACIVN